MSGPWEEYQTKSASVEDGPWAEYQDKDEITKESLFQDRQQQILPDLAKNLVGVVDTAAGMFAGMPANIYGGLRGASSILAGEGVDKATERLEDARKSNFGFGEFKPFTKRGAEFSEAAGKALNKPVEIAGDLGEALGGNEGRFVGELLSGSAMELLDPLLPAYGVRAGMRKYASKSTPKAELPTPKLESIADRMEKELKAPEPTTPEAPIKDTRPSKQLSQEAYETALREKQLQRESAFNRPDQFPDMVQESPMDRMVRDLGGEPMIKEGPDTPMTRMADELTSERSTPDQRAIQEQLDARQAAMEQDVRQRATLELQAADRARQEQAPAVSPEQARYAEEQRMVAEARQAEATRIEQQQRALEQEQRDLDAAKLIKFKRDQIQKDIDTRQAQLEQDVRVQRLRDEEARIRSMLGERATAEQLRSQAELAQQNRPQVLPDPNNPVRGVDNTSPDIRKRLQEEEMFSNRPQTDERVKERRQQEAEKAAMEARLVEIEQELRNTAYKVGGDQQGPKTRAEQRKQKPIGQRGFANKQTGAIQLPFSKKPAVDQLKKVEGIKDKLRNFFPSEQTVAEVIQEHSTKKTPDLDQNFLQKASNHLTKGSLYMAQKTDNPVIRVVGEYIRKANNLAMEATGRLIHDDLAPKGRALSGKEKADVWAVQQIAEAKGIKLTEDFLRKEGFNQKQIDWVTTHASVMDDMYSKLGESMKAAGLEPVSARVAYLASKARGDFRKLVSKETVDANGKPVTTVVGILGDNTRGGLEKQVSRLKKDHPEYKIGEERYYGGRRAKGTEEGFTQMLDFLSKNDPNIGEFVKHVNDMLTQDAFQYMNAKTHTMQKKRVFGMEGRKLYSDAVKNAEEGMQAQVRYAETMIKWSELSKAIAELKPLLKADNGLDMPLAKQWANEYIQGALGNSPGRLGEAIDSVTAALGKGTGLGTTVPGRVVSGMKQYVNGLLLGWVNPGFLLANLVQAPRTMPEMARWLQTKGVDVGADIGLGRAMVTLEKEMTGQKLSPIETQAIEYAHKNHVYSSNLFESGNTVKPDLSYVWQKGTQFIASGLEAVTRKGTYLAYVHMLDASGVKPKDGLFEAAQNLTDTHMNNYAQSEAPRVYQETGGIGRSAYNLMSFKHNELSRLAMLARELPQGTASPAMIAIASQIAFAGLMGTVAFAEADYLYQKITAMMGKPTSLTKLLLDNPDIPNELAFGMGAMAEVDMTSRMGMQLTPGSAIDLVAPGMGKLGDIAGAAGQLISQPNTYNAANLAREVLPLSVGGLLDRTVFETDDGMALNRNKVSASAVRNDADKLWKALGMTGMNESIQKKLSYEDQKIDQIYQDKRNKVIDGAIKDYYMRGEFPANWLEQYTELQGDPAQGKAAIKERIMALNVDRPTKEKMQLAASKSITSKYNLMRRMGQEK